MAPLPKKKHSRARRGGRAAHNGMRKPSFGECPNCQNPKLPHIVCRNCGYYNGREVLPAETGIE
jgi:large subunit ribosomal protein L32